MKLYLRFIENAFQQNLIYKTDVVMHSFNQIFTLFVQISVWFALYAGKEIAQSNVGTISIREMVIYVILSTGISMVINNQVIGEMDEKIKSGIIAMDLIKPMNLFANMLCYTLGNNLFRIVFQLLPILVIGLLIFDLSIPSSIYGLLFVVSLINAFFLYYVITFTIGLIGFWYLSIWHMSRLLEDVVRLFGGIWIPLWFFPRPLAVISEYLPFQYIYYIPINLYLEKIPIDKAIGMLINQVVWILILSGLCYFVWTKGKRKLVIQGG